MGENEAPDLPTQPGVELAERLVEEQGARPGDKRAHERDAGALPSRQGGWIAVGVAGQIGALQRLRHRGAPGGPAPQLFP